MSNTSQKLCEYLTVKHGFAFKGEFFTDSPTTDVLATPGNFAIGGGFQYEKMKYYSGPVPEDYVLQPGDLLVTMTDLSKAGDTLGYPALVPAGLDFRLLHNQRIGLVQIKDESTLDARYLYYRLRADDYRKHILGSATGSTVRHTSPGRICEFELQLPGVEEQRAIADVLGSLDDKIEQNRLTGRKLEELARAVFKAWFVDFEPVKAKAAGAAGFPGMPAETFATLPSRLVDSELGRVPEGWEAGSLADAIGLLQGFAFKSKDWSESGVPVVKIGSVKPGIVDLQAVSYVSEEIAAAASKYRLSPGDLLIGMTGYVGEVGLIPPTANLPLLNQRVSKVLLKSPGTLGLGFAYCFMRREEFKAEVEAKSHGTAQANVSASGILSVPLVVPPQSLCDAFNSFAKPLLDLILAGVGESAKLATLRDYLLPRLLSGQVRVGQ